VRLLKLFGRAFHKCHPAKQRLEQRFEISGKPSTEQQRARINFISSGYFSVLRIPLLQGRIWDESETMHGSKLALINQTLAHNIFRTAMRSAARSVCPN